MPVSRMRAASLLFTVCVSLFSVALAQDACPIDSFVCGGDNAAPGAVLVPSWCQYTNPFLVPQPPTKLANASTDLIGYSPQYSCADTSDPFSSCQLIETFYSYEAVGVNDTTVKMVVVASRDSSAAKPTSSLSIYDAFFNLVIAPDQGYWGAISSIDVQELIATNGSTSLVVYGGAAYNNFSYFPAPPCDDRGCTYFTFIELDARVPGGIANLSAFTFSGDVFDQPAVTADVKLFTAALGSDAAAALNRRVELLTAGDSDAAQRSLRAMRRAYRRTRVLLSPEVEAEAAAAQAGEPSLPLDDDDASPTGSRRFSPLRREEAAGPAAFDAYWRPQRLYDALGEHNFAALLIYNSDPANAHFGWSVLISMYFPAGSPLCAVYEPAPYQYACMLPVARWRVLSDGRPIPANESMSLRTASTFYNCSLPSGADALPAAYAPFYGPGSCGGKTALFFVGTDTTVSTFAFALQGANVTDSLDLALSPAARTFDASELGPGTAISAFYAFSEVTLLAPPAGVANSSAGGNGSAAGPLQVQPSSVWLSIATYVPGVSTPPALTDAPGGGGRGGARSFRDAGVRWGRGRNSAGASESVDSGASGPQGSLLVMRLPQFSDPIDGAFPPQVTPSFANPAGVEESGWSCGWVEFWNGTACAPQPYEVVLAGAPDFAGTLAVQWRSLPQPLVATLVEAGCYVYDTACISRWINSTFNSQNGSSPSFPPQQQQLTALPRTGVAPLPGFTSPAAAAIYARMGPQERHYLRQLWSALAGHVERGALSAANPGGSAGPDPATNALLAAAYGNRFLMFGAGESLQEVFVIDAMPLGCLPADGTRTVSSLQTTLSLMGAMRTLHVTPNAQYLFGGTTRPQFALHSMERVVAVCNALAADPTDPFLAQYAPACSSTQAGLHPRLPSVPDFLAVASACLPGLMCPSFNEEEVQQLPAGSYTTFGFDVVPCEPGFTCSNGQRTPCPQSFVCPFEGMSIPLLCNVIDPSYNSTCAETGLTQAHTCGEGTMCGVPYMPPIPAPPGYAQSFDAGTGNRDLLPCPPGEWCGLGRSTSEGNATLCPAGTSCATSNVLEPTVCNLGGNCTAQSCPSIPYCPAGTVTEQLCPAGSWCPNPTTAHACSLGSYCPAGSPIWSLCPAAHYCEDPADKDQCTGGSFCIAGSVAPSQCSWLSHCFCEGGCAEPPANMVLAVAALLIITIAALYALWRFWLRAIWRAKREAWKQERLRRARRRMRSARAREQGSLNVSASARGERGSNRSGGGLALLSLEGAGNRTASSSHLRPLLAPEADAEGGTAATDVDAGDASGRGRGAKSVRFAGSSPTHSTTLSVAEGYAALAGAEASAEPSVHSAAGSAAHNALALVTGTTAEDDAATLSGTSGGSSRASGRYSMRSSRPLSMAISRKAFPVHITFERLGLRLKSDRTRMVLDGVTGGMRPGRICAIMGPSGAGKTTMLTTLTGKASYGELTGSVFINGKPGMLTEARWKHMLGFVPQDDIMMRDLTVEENIMFAAMTRLPSSWSSDRKLAFGDYVIELLGLSEIRNSPIGDEATRGISGGQRKRVNIGIELAADPVILALDEPTSGLDAAGCTAVCAALRRIADTGVTVTLVLHQPRYEIFQSFDDLLLLGKGGKTVYTGPTAQALAYFEETMQVRCPPRINPADWMLDCISGDLPADWKAAHPDWKPSDLFASWDRHCAAVAAAGGGSELAKRPASGSHGTSPQLAASTLPGPGLPTTLVLKGTQPAEVTPATGLPSSGVVAGVAPTSLVPSSAAPPSAEPVGFLSLIMLFLSRSLSQQLRHPFTIALNNGLVAVSALFLAAVYFGDVSYVAPEPIEAFGGCPSEVASSCQVCLAEAQDSVLNRGVMTIIALALTGVATFLNVFGSERIVYWREASALPQPLHTVAYFLGKDISMLPQLLLGPLVFTTAYEALTTPRASFGEYYIVFLGVYWCASAFGYLTAVLAPPSLAQLLGVTAIFSNAMFAGGQPTLKALQAKWIPLRWMPDIIFMRYSLESIYVCEVAAYNEVVSLQGVSLEQLVQDNFGYDLGAFGRDVAIVFAIGTFLRLLAIVSMVVMHRDKKK